jgi:hypothetical protein
MNNILQNLITIKPGARTISENKLNNQIKIKLYNHQLETVDKMLSIEEGECNDTSMHTSFGILADPVGSGKTLEVLSLIAAKPSLKVNQSKDIKGDNKRLVVSDRMIYQVSIPYIQNTEFVFKNDTQSYIYGRNNFLTSISYSYYNINAKKPNTWSFELIDTNIIAVPHNVISHWRTTLEKQTKLKGLIISRTLDLPKHTKDLNSYDVVIMSFPRLKNFMELYLKNMYDDDKHYYVNRFIVDEAHTYKGRFSYYWPESKHTFSGIFKINSIFIWWMSSSYASLFTNNSNINIITPLSVIFNDCGTSILEKITVKHGADDIQESIKLPPKYHYKIFSELSQMWQSVISNFKSILTTEALAAINANDYDEAINRLGIEEIAPENLLDAMTQKMQDEIDNMIVMLDAKKKIKYKSESYKQKVIQQSEEDIAEKKSKLENIIKTIKEGEDCPICYGEPDENNKALLQCCYKKVCLECLVTYFTQKFECPSCAKTSPKYISIGKHKLKDKKINKKNKDDQEYEGDPNFDFDTKKELLKWIPTNNKVKASKILAQMSNKNKTKDEHFDLLCQLLTLTNEEPSLLVFSSYDGTFNSCKSTLKKYDMNSKEIKGTPDHINKMVKEYNNKDLSCLLLNSKHMGFGMNLQITTDIVIMHKMDPEMENQVIGRAYRIGKKTPLRVWYIYHQSEDDN